MQIGNTTDQVRQNLERMGMATPQAMPVIAYDLRADGWDAEHPDDQPHWDGIVEQIREWLLKKGVLVTFGVEGVTSLLPVTECVVLVAPGQSAEHLGLDVRRIEIGMTEFEFRPNLIHNHGRTLVCVEFVRI